MPYLKTDYTSTIQIFGFFLRVEITSIRMDIIKINKKKISVGEDVEKLEFLLVEMQNGAGTMENSYGDS